MAKEKKSKTIVAVFILGLLGIGAYLLLKPKKKKEDEVLKDVYDNLTFETGKSVIQNSSFPFLDELANVLKKVPLWQLKVVGHTDSQGSEIINLTLSKKRAEAVKDYLIKSGVTNGIVTDGFGETKPIADNSTPEGREKNRRVEFSIIKA
jgi:OOP family OmpA-OmpF porin